MKMIKPKRDVGNPKWIRNPVLNVLNILIKTCSIVTGGGKCHHTFPCFKSVDYPHNLL